MQLRKVARKATKLKISISGPAGAGKSFSSLKLGYGFCKDWSKIAVIDTENGSADLYEDLGSYNVLTLNEFSVDRYIEAIKTCEKAGMEVIIIDSISHEWENLLELHQKLGGRFQDFSVVTPLHNKFKQAILQSPCHIIVTLRSETAYSIDVVNGKSVVTKHGLESKTRKGFEYEVTLALTVDQNNLATASKDRTGIFFGKEPDKITEEWGEKLADWSKGGGSDLEQILQNAIVEVNNSASHEELKMVHKRYTELHSTSEFMTALKERKEELTVVSK